MMCEDWSRRERCGADVLEQQLVLRPPSCSTIWNSQESVKIECVGRAMRLPHANRATFINLHGRPSRAVCDKLRRCQLNWRPETLCAQRGERVVCKRFLWDKGEDAVRRHSLELTKCRSLWQRRVCPFQTRASSVPGISSGTKEVVNWCGVYCAIIIKWVSHANLKFNHLSQKKVKLFNLLNYFC
jgi:hypothetical protein